MEDPNIIPSMPPNLMLYLTLSGSNYYLEQLFMVPNVFEPLANVPGDLDLTMNSEISDHIASTVLTEPSSYNTTNSQGSICLFYSSGIKSQAQFTSIFNE